MGHYYSLESSKIDLLFVGGQVRSEINLIELDFFCGCNEYGIYSQSCVIVIQIKPVIFLYLVVLLELSSNSELRKIKRHHFRIVVVVALLFYVHGKHLRSCRDGQLT